MIEVTSNAAAQIHKMLAKRGSAETGLRIGVKAGGCSGFEYTFGWEREPKATDTVFEGEGGAKVYVDPRSLRLNFEFDVECHDRNLADTLTLVFETRRRTAREITLAEADSRPLPVRLRDGLARLAAPFL